MGLLHWSGFSFGEWDGQCRWLCWAVGIMDGSMAWVTWMWPMRQGNCNKMCVHLSHHGGSWRGLFVLSRSHLGLSPERLTPGRYQRLPELQRLNELSLYIYAFMPETIFCTLFWGWVGAVNQSWNQSNLQKRVLCSAWKLNPHLMWNHISRQTRFCLSRTFTFSSYLMWYFSSQ